MATDIEKLQIAIETVGTKAAQKELTRMKKAAEEAGKGVEGLNNQTKKAPPLLKGFRGATSALTNTTGQLSVQLQDVAVQAQMGTDGLRIFAQQGPQIASIFGPTGAVVGALIAVGAIIAGPFVNSLLAANEQLEKTRKGLEAVKDKIYELTEAEKAARGAILARQMRETKEAIKAAEESLQDAISTNQTFQKGGKDVASIYYQLKNGVITYDEALAQSTEEALTAQANLEDQHQAYKELSDIYDILTGKVDEETEAQKRRKKSIEQTLNQARIQVATLRMSAIEAELFRFQLRGATDDQVKLLRSQLEATAAFEADQQAKKAAKREEDARIASQERFVASIEQQIFGFGKSRAELLRYQASLMNLTPAEMARVEVLADMIEKKERDAQATRDQTKANQEAAKAQRALDALNQAKADLASAFEDDRNKAVAELRQAGLLEEERLQDLSYQRQLEKLKLFLAQKDITEEEFSEAKKQLDKKTQEAAIKTAADGLQALGQYNKTAFDAYKVYASGKAVMDTYAGATKAMAEIPFPYNIAAAAGVVAMGLANVATIQSQQYQGRALGGQVRGGQTYVVGERGPELLTMGGNGTVTPNEKLRGATGTQSVSETVNINFQITANDASGFDQLLASRRGMIVSMIGQAMNNRGRKALV